MEAKKIVFPIFQRPAMVVLSAGRQMMSPPTLDNYLVDIMFYDKKQRRNNFRPLLNNNQTLE
jgi:hypothetical protein